MARLPPVILRLLARFEPRPGWVPVARSIDATGRALVGWAPRADHARLSGGDAATTGLADRPWTMAVERWDAGGGAGLSSLEVDVLDPHLVSLPDGDLLVVGSYARRAPEGEVEANATVFGADGHVAQRFSVGDGVLDAQESAAGDVWLAYTEEGVMGDYGWRGWGRIAADEWIAPLGESGLVRRTVRGDHEPIGYVVAKDTLAIAGCHALNIWGDEVWLSYHPGFPLVRLRPDAPRASWSTRLPAVIDSFAVDGPRVLAHAGRREGVHRLWLGHLRDDGTMRATELEPHLEGDVSTAALRHVVGRGPVLHAFTDEAWYRADVRQL